MADFADLSDLSVPIRALRVPNGCSCLHTPAKIATPLEAAFYTTKTLSGRTAPYLPGTMDPNFRVNAYTRSLARKDPASIERMTSALRSAGLPA